MFIHSVSSIATYELPRWLSSIKKKKKSPVSAGDLGLFPELGTTPSPLEKEMATHSCILAWKIPWTGSLEGYSPCGHKRFGQNRTITICIFLINKNFT